MSRFDLWIIERRDESGKLEFSDPQPDKVFGHGALTGMTEDEMAQAILRAIPDATLSGTNIPNWPRLIHPQFTARRKTW